MIPSQTANNAELRCFIWCLHEQALGQQSSYRRSETTWRSSDAIVMQCTYTTGVVFSFNWLSWYIANNWGFCREIGAWVIVSPPYGTFIWWCNSPKISSSRADDTCPLAADIASHYDDVTMRLMASQSTSLTIVYSTVYSGADKKKTSKLRVTGLCAGNSPGTGEFPAQMASNAENVSIWWRHHDCAELVTWCGTLHHNWG